MLIKVYTQQHTLFDAKILVNTLLSLGYNTTLTQTINRNESNVLYIIYAASTLRIIPRHFIIYQTEVFGSHHFGKWYYTLMKHALTIWEYNEHHLVQYKAIGLTPSLVPPSVSKQHVSKKTIPILFYGWVHGSPRREKILNELKKHTQIEVVTNLLGHEMWQKLHRSKVVVNLHYYHNAPLELFRVNEALSHNCHIVSEPPICGYNGFIEFGNTPKDIAEKANYLTTQMFDKDISSLNNIEHVRSAMGKVKIKLQAIGINM